MAKRISDPRFFPALKIMQDLPIVYPRGKLAWDDSCNTREGDHEYPRNEY
jgi:hypothetical protein